MKKRKDLNAENHEGKDLSPEEELYADNIIKAMEFDLKFDRKTHIDEDAPPELIQEWLEAVSKREVGYQNAPKVRVYDFLGKPDFTPLEQLDDDAGV